MSVTAARGFVAAGGACGVKADGADLALVATEDRRAVAAAGVFTTNLVQAAPVQISRRHLGDRQAGAVVLNSGNANAATGEDGRHAAERTCAAAATALGLEPSDVLVCSTGLIGYQLPVERIEAGLPGLVERLDRTPRAGEEAADAILTTDTVRKEARAVANLQGGVAVVGGMAKGAAMLAPSMATMLAVLTTDAAVEPDALQAALVEAVVPTFDTLLVDGCTSTNDTVLVLANGRCGNDPVRRASVANFHAFADALTEVCGDLARQMACDAEGATTLARIRVIGARSSDDARRAARGVAASQLVQCSLYGKDPYWGRILSELGASGAHLDPERVDIAYDGVRVCHQGVASDHDADALARVMAQTEIEITCDLNFGIGEAVVLTTDLTHAYVDENMGTS